MDELFTIIGVFTLFFALETTLSERSRQSFCALAKLIGWHVARLSTCGITVIVEFREEGCLVGAAHCRMIGVSVLFSSPSHIYALTPCRNIQEPQSGCTKAWWMFSKRQCAMTKVTKGCGAIRKNVRALLRYCCFKYAVEREVKKYSIDERICV
ncbi:hypothetical protein B0H14DRAFT_2954567 [Mycena olivaceomarginata]|nr:hypothetical protein B0H14DRAFT_2954567 [Mycena olivaceomarginata]